MVNTPLGVRIIKWLKVKGKGIEFSRITVYNSLSNLLQAGIGMLRTIDLGNWISNVGTSIGVFTAASNSDSPAAAVADKVRQAGSMSACIS